MIFSTRLESFSKTENAWLPEATSPIPGGVADDLLDEAGVLQQHGKCLAGRGHHWWGQRVREQVWPEGK